MNSPSSSSSKMNLRRMNGGRGGIYRRNKRRGRGIALCGGDSTLTKLTFNFNVSFMSIYLFLFVFPSMPRRIHVSLNQTILFLTSFVFFFFFPAIFQFTFKILKNINYVTFILELGIKLNLIMINIFFLYILPLLNFYYMS